MTFLAEFRCYIGSQTLAPWPTALAGLLPPWPTTLGPNGAAHDARLLTPWRCYVWPTLRAHSWWLLPPWVTALYPWRRRLRRQMYIFAKFVADHIFLQNHDKINIKKIRVVLKFPPISLFICTVQEEIGGRVNNTMRCDAYSSVGSFWPPPTGSRVLRSGWWLPGCSSFGKLCSVFARARPEGREYGRLSFGSWHRENREARVSRSLGIYSQPPTVQRVTHGCTDLPEVRAGGHACECGTDFFRFIHPPLFQL
jgi:hypothetical protein